MHWKKLFGQLLSSLEKHMAVFNVLRRPVEVAVVSGHSILHSFFNSRLYPLIHDFHSQSFTSLLLIHRLGYIDFILSN